MFVDNREPAYAESSGLGSEVSLFGESPRYTANDKYFLAYSNAIRRSLL